uniref:DNA-directed RNA polymerase subunit n=1 Tax=Hepatozoon canis TaxID=110120 RepID=A0A3S8TEN2_9APIC|nr:RNA polymerase C subunit C1 [Hepatozoon canis]
MINLLNLNISVVSPKTICTWASRSILGMYYIGEVYYPETINHSSGNPITYGLFCTKIFGPILSWKCTCLKIYKLYRHICILCGNEINSNTVRRFRMGVLFFKIPVFHTWYFKDTFSLLPIILNCSNEILNNLIYYKHCKNLLNYNKCNFPYIDVFKKLSFIQLIYISIFLQKYLNSLNIINNIIVTKEKLLDKNSINLTKLYKKLLILNTFFFNKLSLSWVLLDNFPIIPPDLRPIIKINKNKFIVSYINSIYKNIIIFNNKIKFLNTLSKIPIIFEINEKINLQKSVDNIMYKHVESKNINFILRSLSGKIGIFRQNLLGKRVDYSGRSVITSGSDINFSKVGIPLSVACNLFSPIVYNIIKKYRTIKFILNNINYIYTSILYRRLITRIFKTNIIIINRAPTLHRLNIQGFKPYLIEGRAIKLYPLVCSSFNADFDGDQMSVILTMSKPSRLEAKYILSSDKNFISPATGVNLFKLNQIFLLGLFMINTLSYKTNKKSILYFNSIDELLYYTSSGIIEPQNYVWLKLKYISVIKNIFYNNFIFTSIVRFMLIESIFFNIKQFNI